MFKKIIISFILLAVLAGCAAVPKGEKSQTAADNNQYIKAVFMSYYELAEFTNGSSEKEFKKNISKAFKALASNGFNRVTVQVRPCADAFYNSAYFPTSEYCFGYQGAELIYDPLQIMTSAAHKYGLSIEAWVNPYRVSQSSDFSALAENNIALKWQNTSRLIVLDNGIYFNPAYSEATDLIVNGVREIVTNYDVDSVCFDDYFYPTNDKNIDESEYNSYKNSGGDMTLQDWRRDNVSKMVQAVYSAVKSAETSVTFGISPASDMDNDYSTLFADVVKWASTDGYVDYICPQVYFGFKNENQPFMQTVKKWCSQTKCTLYVALPMYKNGKTDDFAGELGKNEFKKENDIVARQVEYISKLERVSGYYVFSYSSLKEDESTSKLYSAMQNSSR